MDAREVQLAKAFSPIPTTLYSFPYMLTVFGIVTEVTVSLQSAIYTSRFSSEETPYVSWSIVKLPHTLLEQIMVAMRVINLIFIVLNVIK